MENNSRSRLFASSDPDNLRSISTILSAENKQANVNKQLSNYFTDSVYLDREWHEETNYSEENQEEKAQGGTWRLKERMKTSGVALVVCLNIGIDPPDIVKPNPCARKECWFDPTGSKQKGLEFIGNALQQQYEKWQSKAKYKQCLDPTSDELRKVCINLRKNSKNDRLLLHYNGHGVPKPTKNGELWVFGKYYTHYTPVAICELRGWIGDPAIYVLDCSAAGVLISHLVDSLSLKGANASDKSGGLRSPSPSAAGAYSEGSKYTMDGPTIVLAACKANEVLPMNPLYPADLFTSCLTTPIAIAIRWFILQVSFSYVKNIFLRQTYCSFSSYSTWLRLRRAAFPLSPSILTSQHLILSYSTILPEPFLNGGREPRRGGQHPGQGHGPQDPARRAELDLYRHHRHDRLDHTAQQDLSKDVPPGSAGGESLQVS